MSLTGKSGSVLTQKEQCILLDLRAASDVLTTSCHAVHLLPPSRFNGDKSSSNAGLILNQSKTAKKEEERKKSRGKTQTSTTSDLNSSCLGTSSLEGAEKVYRYSRTTTVKKNVYVDHSRMSAQPP
jgi:hypothetical protein